MARFLRWPIAGHAVFAAWVRFFPRRYQEGQNELHIPRQIDGCHARGSVYRGDTRNAQTAVLRAERGQCEILLEAGNESPESACPAPHTPSQSSGHRFQNKVSSSPSSPPYSDGHRRVAFLTQNQHFYFQHPATVPTHLGRQKARG